MRIDRGDVVWADMSPTRGHEQSGHRPYLVLSDERLHSRMRILIAVPLTTARRPWPTRVELERGSYAICEQPKSIALERITKHEPRGHDVTEVRRIVSRLIGG